MTWFKRKIKKIESDIREKEINDAIYSVKNKILYSDFSHKEQYLIISTVLKDFVEEKELKHKEILAEAQELKDILTQLER